MGVSLPKTFDHNAPDVPGDVEDLDGTVDLVQLGSKVEAADVRNHDVRDDQPQLAAKLFDNPRRSLHVTDIDYIEAVNLQNAAYVTTNGGVVVQNQHDSLSSRLITDRWLHDFLALLGPKRGY